MERRVFLAAAATSVLVGCTSTSRTATYGSPQMLKIKQQLDAHVSRLPESRSKQVSQALLNKRETYFYTDENGLPAARWRGQGDLGACVHIRPETNQPYLETQFRRSDRKGRAPKYIQFGHTGTWHSRRHNALDKALSREKNWIGPNSDKQGRQLVEELLATLS